MVGVKGIKNCGNVLVRDSDSELTARLCELVDAQGFRVVIIHYFKDTLESDHTTGASRLDPVPEKGDHGCKFILVGNLVRLLGCLRPWL